jgi:Arginase family
MALDFLTPLNEELLEHVANLSSQHLGSKIVFHTKDDFPDLKKIKIAIIGVLENRGDINATSDVNLDFIRKELYSLFPGNWESSIADLGDLLPGETKEDTYFALQKVTAFLLKKNVLPILLGGTRDLTYPLYRAYDDLEQMVNLVAVDSKFDIGANAIEPIRTSYLSKIIADEPNNLFNYSNVGYQTYFNSQEEIDLIEKLYFDAYRLGDVKNNIAIAEPVFRDADIVSLNLLAVKSSDSANQLNFNPNGFDGKEICALARYAGISDKVSTLGIFNHNSSKQEAMLVAQVIWYFIEGFHYRSNEYPFGSKENYIRYIVTFENDDLVFYKSNKSDRWWLEIQNFNSGRNKSAKHTLLPCSYEEYLAACNHEFPERWWKFQRKNGI